MARIYPFRALRYDTSRVRMEDVVTQPYDKITPEMQQRYYDASPYNLIRIILGKHEPGDTEPQEFLPAGERPQLLHPRGRVPEGLARRRILAEEANRRSTATRRPTPCPIRRVRERRGFIALGHLYDYADKVVYRHEQTFPKHKSDRMASSRPRAPTASRSTCSTPTRLHRRETDLWWQARTETRHAPADLAITDEYGVVHRVWKLTDPALINLILTAMADKKLIIADGHHRYETSVAYAKERSAQLRLPLGEPARPDETARSSHLPAPPFPEAAMMMTFVNMDAPASPSCRPTGWSMVCRTSRERRSRPRRRSSST
jgi:uncharacterized protein (DUF1015 family)